MQTDKFLSILAESRNGANHFFRSPLYPKFLYSDGVQALAETGCYWLLDILGTELPAVFKTKNPHHSMLGIVTVNASGGRATLTMGLEDGLPVQWSKDIDITDLPDKEWNLYVSDNGDGTFSCILPSEY